MTPATSPSDVEDLLRFLTPEERAELDDLLTTDAAIWLPLPGPQNEAYWSEADIVGYGGAAGGGKSDLVAGRILTKHKRALGIRLEKAQTEGIIQRLTEILIKVCRICRCARTSSRSRGLSKTSCWNACSAIR